MSDWLQRVRELEPARLRAAWAATIGVAVVLGITISAETDRAVQAGIAFVAALIPLLQGEATRRKVTPTSKLAAEEAAREWLAEPIPDDTDMRDIGGE